MSVLVWRGVDMGVDMSVDSFIKCMPAFAGASAALCVLDDLLQVRARVEGCGWFLELSVFA